VNQGGVIMPVLACIYFDRIEDNPLNRILLAGLRMSIRLTDDLYLRIKLNKLCSQMLNVVSVIELNRDLLLTALCSIDRLTDHYKPVLEIINILFESQGIQWEDSAEQIALHGYMFDMNLFFQSLMSKFLHEYIDRDNYALLDQYVLWDMFSYNPEYNPKGRRQPTLRPDFAIKKNGRIVSLLDAKYRDLWETPLPSEMLYQLAVYAFSGRWSKSKILYPTLHESAKVQKIDIRDPVTDGLLAQVILQPVLLNYIVELISQRGKYKKACDYAHLLAIE
jgi:5-methylcytosine-specific restriction enzyme subunit McrC